MLARKTRSAELDARAELGFGALAQMRGNYPEMLEHAQRAARIADREGLAGIARHAHYGLMVGAVKRGQYGEALVEGQRVLRLSYGDALLEAEILESIGQLLIEAGRAREARACLAAVATRRLPARLLLPALGGLAVTSAQIGE